MAPSGKRQKLSFYEKVKVCTQEESSALLSTFSQHPAWLQNLTNPQTLFARHEEMRSSTSRSTVLEKKAKEISEEDEAQSQSQLQSPARILRKPKAKQKQGSQLQTLIDGSLTQTSGTNSSDTEDYKGSGWYARYGETIAQQVCPNDAIETSYVDRDSGQHPDDSPCIGKYPELAWTPEWTSTRQGKLVGHDFWLDPIDGKKGCGCGENHRARAIAVGGPSRSCRDPNMLGVIYEHCPSFDRTINTLEWIAVEQAFSDFPGLTRTILNRLQRGSDC